MQAAPARRPAPGRRGAPEGGTDWPRERRELSGYRSTFVVRQQALIRLRLWGRAKGAARVEAPAATLVGCCIDWCRMLYRLLSRCPSAFAYRLLSGVVPIWRVGSCRVTPVGCCIGSCRVVLRLLRVGPCRMLCRRLRVGSSCGDSWPPKRAKRDAATSPLVTSDPLTAH